MKYERELKNYTGEDLKHWLIEDTYFGKFLVDERGTSWRWFDLLDTLEEMKFFEAPASTRYHGNYAGGLFEHSFHVMSVLCEMTEELDLEWGLKRSPVIVGLLHDLCKIDQYKWDKEQGIYTFSDEPLVKGHGIKSVVYIQQFLGIDLTEEETACILYHMGAFTESKEWSSYNRAIQKYPNVLWTHTADMVASQIMGV